jgi:hypothetical protein
VVGDEVHYVIHVRKLAPTLRICSHLCRAIIAQSAWNLVAEN